MIRSNWHDFFLWTLLRTSTGALGAGEKALSANQNSRVLNPSYNPAITRATKKQTQIVVGLYKVSLQSIIV